MGSLISNTLPKISINQIEQTHKLNQNEINVPIKSYTDTDMLMT